MFVENAIGISTIFARNKRKTSHLAAIMSDNSNDQTSHAKIL